MSEVCLIVAVTPSDGIGANGSLPWKLSGDLKRFRGLTSKAQSGKTNAVIMGRKTWESLPVKPLPGRLNLIVSSSLKDASVSTFETVQSAIAHAKQDALVDKIFIIGGAGIYKAALEGGWVDRAYVTRIGIDDWKCDVFFPQKSLHDWKPVCVSKTIVENGIPHDYIEYEKFNDVQVTDNENEGDCNSDLMTVPRLSDKFSHEEYQYLSMIEKIIKKGVKQEDRTGVGTLSVFGELMRFDLSESFPLLTTKRVFWKGVVEELLWFIKGDTNANRLAEKGVRIWDGNGSREFLDSRGLSHREVGDLGPVYGFQWRHFGAQYKDMHSDYTNEGVDQLMECINKVKNNPTDRRIIMTAWNPAHLSEMALPPCHMFAQFNVADGKLSCAMYQRSCDMGLGVPFNIASYSLLTCMMAQVCGLQPGEFIHNLGNAHVYLNHVEPLKEQLKRTPRPFPILKINPLVDEIDKFSFDDFKLIGYHPWGKIAMEMAV